MTGAPHIHTPGDSRLLFYRTVKQVVLLVAVGVLVKSCVFDAIKVKGDQMDPTIVSGDRLLIFKTPYLPLVKNVFRPHPGRAIIFRHPLDINSFGCLRVAAISGGSITIDSGKVIVARGNKLPGLSYTLEKEILPRRFSPRDFMDIYTVPSPGQILDLDSMTLRDFFFSVSIIRQENTSGSFTLTPSVVMDDTSYLDFPLHDFSLYKGTLKTVPDNYRYDWFFWDRLQDYLQISQGDTTAKVAFSFSLNGRKLDKYTVRDKYIFLLADNWSGGLDSRYFGPVDKNAVVGSVLSVLWSYGKNLEGHPVFRLSRLGRFLL